MGSRDDQLKLLAGRLSAGGRHPFTRQAAERAGLNVRARQRLLDGGFASSPHDGVLRISTPAGLPDRALAAALTLPDGGAIGRRTAAELLGVDPRTPWERDTALDVECLVPRGRVPVRRPGIRCFATELDPGDVHHSWGFPATTPERTAADLLRWLPPFMAIAVLDRMARLDLVSTPRIGAILDRWDGHRNVGTARRLLDAVEPRAESYGESWLRLRILDAGFPRPEAQVRILDGDREVYRLDLGWPHLRVGAEYDGEEFHGDRAAQEHDEHRRTQLWERYGWTVVGFRKGHVLGSGTTLEFGLGELLGMTPIIRRPTGRA